MELEYVEYSKIWIISDFFYVGYALIQSRQPGAVKMELIEQLEYFGLETD